MSSWNFLSVLLISYLLGYVAECEFLSMICERLMEIAAINEYS